VKILDDMDMGFDDVIGGEPDKGFITASRLENNECLKTGM